MPFGGSEKSRKEQEAQENLVKKTQKKVHTLSASKNWYMDRHERLVIQRNVLFIFTIITLIFLGLSVLAVSELNKRKVFEPFVIEVEDKSGIVTQVTRKNVEQYTADEMIIRYFIYKYVTARESYNPVTHGFNYNQVVRLMSSSKVYNQFGAMVDTQNPDSPLRLGRNIVREVRIKSISFMDPEKRKAQVRIVHHDADVGTPFSSNRGTKQHYLITMEYKFLDLNLPPSARYINPLGYQVVTYAREREDIR